jgi:hypothetical protein
VVETGETVKMNWGLDWSDFGFPTTVEERVQSPLELLYRVMV